MKVRLLPPVYTGTRVDDAERKSGERPMVLKILLRPEAGGGYSASVPTMPGCHSQGETRDEALANIREAAELWAEVQAERVLREEDL